MNRRTPSPSRPRCRAACRVRDALLAALVTATAATPALAQELPTLEPEDYGRWEYLLSPQVSPFGDWVAHRLTRNDETEELRLRRMDPDTTIVVPWGESPAFSADGRWAVWQVGTSPEEREDPDGPARLTVEVMDLRTGLRRELGPARSATFDVTGRFLALSGYPPEEPEGRGGDLRVLDLPAGTEVTVSAVEEAEWAPEAAVLAMILATGTDQGNGVQVFDAGSGSLRGLDGSGSRYAELSWREDGPGLAVLRSDSVASSADAGGYTLLAWRDPARPADRLELASDAPQIPDSLWIAPHRTPEWLADGDRIGIGLRPRPAEETTGDAEPDSAAAAPPEDTTTVQIWHTSDVRLVPAQRVRADADARRTLLAIWEPGEDRVVVVGTDLLATTDVVADGRWAVERTDAPYGWGAMFGRPYHDVWSVDLDDGTRRLAAERVRYEWTSPDGDRLVWFDGTDYHAGGLGGADPRNLTGSLDATFANTGWDTPTDGVLPPHGMGGWDEGGGAVYLYDRFDVWRVPLDGSEAMRLTEGAEGEVVHRIQDVDPDRDTHPAGEPLLFQVRDEWTEARGWARWSAGEGYEPLLLEDRSHWSLQRADSADLFVFRVESREEAPDLVMTDGRFGDRRLVAESNPFQSEYAWTRSEMVEYVDGEDRRQHGVLLYPANHDASRRYPMIVYAYEILSPQRHVWEAPSERDYYSFTAWTQEGYFVLLPDIVFRARDPGVSTAEAVGAAIEAVNAQGLIDRDRVGFIGHSWGGYEATYLAARTDLFATTVAGAPLTDFLSFMGQIHWNPGVAELSHWETGQARMEVPYWEDPDAHERNSPIHGVHEMSTPILMAHGSEDGVVEFWQATEFYNFARRAEKPMVLLVYEGEDHGFTQEANQIDYHRRILEWFGHYLKGEEAPAWIREGVSWERHPEERARLAGEGRGGAG
ncbi:MAG TPA: YqiA/YcfP family alpha/beta fold hydrolase [Longimicrobiales bacterium]|nr:YqiA/YcfP family alpha/beta fold hydrolase [Longimicrobiales bacterium]